MMPYTFKELDGVPVGADPGAGAWKEARQFQLATERRERIRYHTRMITVHEDIATEYRQAWERLVGEPVS
jgi:hypothetical protein